jgi:hypothetical protein
MPTLEYFEDQRAKHFDDEIARLKKKIEELYLFVDEQKKDSPPIMNYENTKIKDAYRQMRKHEDRIKELEKMKMEGREERLQGIQPSFWSRFIGGKSKKRIRRTGRRKLHKRTRK